MTAAGVILDTNALIRLQLKRPVPQAALAALNRAEEASRLFVSVVSAWEIAMLARRSSSRTGRIFSPDPETWFRKVLASPGVAVAPVSIEVAMRSCNLDGLTTRDPADRLLVSQAQALNVPLLTRDQAILDYAALGHVRAITC